MKIFARTIFLFFVIFSCKDSSIVPSDQVSYFNKNVGSRIPLATAEAWIGRFDRSNGRTKTDDLVISAEKLKSLLDPIDEKLGVSFHRAITSEGHYRTLLIGVYMNGSLGTAYDLESGNSISENIRIDWCLRYKEQNVKGPWSHFFGIEVFNQITASDGFEKLGVHFGLNDENVTQLILLAWSTEHSTGRSESATAYDMSFPCPNTCP